ncbi:L-lactate permease [Aliidiomarina minuta]|uniref:L-lactate permease n=1 Tax=Aliidiomarina minuta TaxID=880057 RepID=A0A432W5K3_9GAMM|nr:L-lactate permease [Aliidiomarina minuta]RUO25322.1 L-lactate permease [Aliidiomarina minuta]
MPLLAAAPIALILVLMLFWRWSAGKAGLAGLALTLVLAITFFEFASVSRIMGSMTEAAFISLTILWIIFSALSIYELQRRTQALVQLQAMLSRLSHDPRLSALLIAWFFSLFMEGAAGFGTSAALAAPFLVSAGFRPVQAVIIALVGHAAGVSFGAVGTPIMPQLAVTPFSGAEIAAATVLYHGIAGWFLAAVCMKFIVRDLPQGPLTQGLLWSWTAFAAACFLLPYMALAYFVGPELPTLAGSIAGASLFVAGLRLVYQRPLGDIPWRALAPYLILIALVLFTRLLPPVQQLASSYVWHWQWETFSGSFAPLYHPGSLLVVSFFMGALLQKASREEILDCMRTAGLKLLPVLLALITMLGLSRLMLHAGMVDTLAISVAAIAGLWWPLMAPFVGMTGTFVTGSATASNILLTDFQQTAAERGNFAPLPLVGAQGFGAALGNMICPHNIIAAGATVGIAGQEGQVLRQTLWVAVIAAFIGGLLALILS